MVNSTVFYTKNGINLGTVFDNVPPGLYPTVGLHSPGEIVDANFGKIYKFSYGIFSTNSVLIDEF